MPSRKRFKTRYPGVYYVDTISKLTGKQENIYFIMYRKDGKKIEEKVGGQYKDAMTPAKASHIRTLKVTGRLVSNREHRQKINERVTLNYLFNIFKEQKKHLRSLRDDISRYENHIRNSIGDKIVSEITPIMLYKLRNRVSKELKPATVKQILVLIQRIINFCHSMQLCPRLDFKIEMPKFDNTKTEDMTDKQFKRFMSILNDYEGYHASSVNIMRIALFTGMRRSEIYGLQWRDIDFDRGFVNIKNGKGVITESIPMNNLTRNVLKSVSRTQGSEYIFPNSGGGRLHKDAYFKHFKRIRKLAGLPKDFRPMHGLRHTFASTLASSGEVDLYTLQRLLTHKSPGMTQRYAHLRDDTLKKASGVFDAFEKKLKVEDYN